MQTGFFSSVLVGLIFCPAFATADDVHFYTFDSPPYQTSSNSAELGSNVTGFTVETVKCAMAATGKNVQISVVPQRRALHFLVRGKIDGYFAVDLTTSLNSVAGRTAPISLEKWYLVSRADAKPIENPRLGAINGSNEQDWLRSEGAELFVTVRTAQQLINLLQRKRIDQALMDQRVLESLTGKEGLSSRFLRYVPLHVYFSDVFMARNPGFVELFNQHIPHCINGSFELEPSEKAQIRGIAYNLMQELLASVHLIKTIESGPRIEDQATILELDKEWRSKAPQKPSSLAKKIAESPASRILADWQAAKKGLITEVLLTNDLGTLIAMSQLTSDYWQGDEAKFQQHFRNDTADLFVSPIRYDASTARFQVTVSMPVTASRYSKPVGVMILGVDIEKALTSEHHLLDLHEPANL